MGAKLPSTELRDDGMARTLHNDEINYLRYLIINVLINGKTEIKAVDMMKSNGVVRGIDRALIPPAPNVVENVLVLADMGEDSEFTVIKGLLASKAFADITQSINNVENVTVFTPTDAVFGEIVD